MEGVTTTIFVISNPKMDYSPAQLTVPESRDDIFPVYYSKFNRNIKHLFLLFDLSYVKRE